MEERQLLDRGTVENVESIIDIDANIERAEKDIQSKAAFRGHIGNILKNPGEIAKGRKFMQNNPQISRRAENLRDPAIQASNNLSNKEKKKMSALIHSSNRQLESGERSKIKVIKVARSNGKIRSTLIPSEENRKGWESIQIYDDIFILYNPDCKAKNKKVNSLFGEEDKVILGGDVYFFKIDEKGDIIDLTVPEVNSIFDSVKSAKN